MYFAFANTIIELKLSDLKYGLERLNVEKVFFRKKEIVKNISLVLFRSADMNVYSDVFLSFSLN